MPQWSAAAALQAAPDPCGGSSLPPRPPKSACAMDRVEPTRTESLRQGWREFRSMRTALILLLALGVAAIFGSLFPQQNISPQRVQQYFDQHPGLAPILDRLGVFDVFGAPWFMAIYLALLTALTACLVPRLTGYLRQAGSLVFHVSFLLLLLGLAYGKGFGYRGQATIVEGDTWADARINYDAFTPGRFFTPGNLPQFSLRLDDFTNTFYDNLTPKLYASRLPRSTPTAAPPRPSRSP